MRITSVPNALWIAAALAGASVETTGIASAQPAAAGAPAAATATPAEVFERRLLPIFRSPNPSSCVQCHLAGVDLKDYILPDHEQTFRSLRDQGLIDLDAPEKSKILTLIRRGEEADGPRVRAENRRAEYEAFAAWIKASAADPRLRAAPPLPAAERAGGPKPAGDGRGPAADPLLESFERNVWALRFRCMNCHTEGTPQAEKNRKEHGDRVVWVKKAGAAATMAYLLDSKLVDPKAPEQSLLLRKPLGEEKHGGGVKFAVGDQGYKGFRTWLEEAVAAKAGRPAAAAGKGTVRFGSETWLKLADTPPAWADRLLQADVYAWDAAKRAWEPDPVATSDRIVSGKGKVWQHTLTLLAAPGSDRARAWAAGKPALPPGQYLVKVYVDRDGRLAKDWKAALGEGDLVGQAEFRANWRDGYNGMTVVDATKVRR